MGASMGLQMHQMHGVIGDPARKLEPTTIRGKVL